MQGMDVGYLIEETVKNNGKLEYCGQDMMDNWIYVLGQRAESSTLCIFPNLRGAEKSSAG